MPAKICIAFLLFLALFSSANATQLSRTTGEVNFREGPSLSAPVIQILPAGSEVQVLSERRPGWYLVVYRGRPGFVHKNYIKLPEDQRPNRRPPSMHRQLAMPAGMLVAGVGIVLMAS